MKRKPLLGLSSIALILLVLGLVACSDNSKIKDLIRQRLNDPESAKFKDMIVSKDGQRACIPWNAKNRLGGYGDWYMAELKKTNSGWVVESMEVILDWHCSVSGFEIIDLGEKSELDAALEATEILRKVKNISSNKAAKLSSRGGDCYGVVIAYASYSRDIAKNQALNDIYGGYSMLLKVDEEELKKYRDKLNHGDCQFP